MKTVITTATVVAMLTLPAFGEGDPTGSEAFGEARGSFKMSAQEQPDALAIQASSIALGQQAMAQGELPRAKASSKASAKAGSSTNSDNQSGFSAESLKSPTGMDGGNRK